MSTKRADILTGLTTILEGIPELVAAGAGGVKRFQQGGVKLDFIPVAYIHWQSDRVVREISHLLFERSITFQVFVFFETAAGEGGITSTDEELDLWAARVEAAVMADRTLSGAARDTLLVSSRALGPNEGMPAVGVSVEFEARYQTNNLGGT